MTMVYLAGPEVFLPDAIAIGKQKQEVCEDFGLVGLFPLDNVVKPSATETIASAIYQANVAMIQKCDAVVANLTPFRSHSADPGTAFELGMAAALGKSVYAYTNAPLTLLERIEEDHGGLEKVGDVVFSRLDDLVVEDFGLFDNLMLAECLTQPVAQSVVEVSDPTRDMESFIACIETLVGDLEKAGTRPSARELVVDEALFPRLFHYDIMVGRLKLGFAVDDYLENKAYSAKVTYDYRRRNTKATIVFASKAERNAFSSYWLK